MHLSRLYIENYRSIEKLDLVFGKGKNVIIGRNNSGKSNIIKALDLLLGQSSPTYAKSDAVNDHDFRCWKERSDDGLVIKSASEFFIWCELSREDGEPLNYDQLYKCYGFYIYSDLVEWVNKRPIKRAIRIPRDILPEQYAKIFAIDEDQLDSSSKEYINPKLRNQRTFEDQFEDKHAFAFAFLAKRENEGDITREIRFLYRENQDSDWVMGFKAQVRNELLQSAIIPSFRDPQNQLRLTNWSWYGKLMQHLTSDQAKSADLVAAFAQVKEVGDRIFDHAKTQITNSALNVAFPGTEIDFQFNADTRLDLYKSCVIYVDDGFKSKLTEKGSGIQSATIIGLFNYYTQNVNRITSALLCIEEPELYLHPHARRVISDRLDDFLDGNRNQVVLTTHSVEFIRTTADDLNLILVQKGDQGTRGLPVKAREFKHLLIDNNQNEIFFADKVIICEGYDDYLVRAFCRELFPKYLDEQNVSVISVGGKDNINRLAELVIRLGIKCFVLADFDYLLRDKSQDRLKYGKNVKAHESILSLGKNFFSQECILGTRGQVAWSYLERLRANVRRDNEEACYIAKSASEIADGRVGKALSRLRQNGVCILSGEIETLAKDQTFLSPTNKLSLNKVFDLHGRLSAGDRITDIFDDAEIREFLETVFQR